MVGYGGVRWRVVGAKIEVGGRTVICIDFTNQRLIIS